MTNGLLTLTETQRAIRDAAAQFVAAEVSPFTTEWDRAEAMDHGIVAKLGDQGILGLMLPEEYGGVPADMQSYTLVMEELGRGDTAVRGIVSVSLGLVAKSIAAHGTAEQKERWLPELATGRGVGCFALTEPDTGSDAASLTTTARRDGDSWVINGSKIFITNGPWASVALTFARTSEKGITAFLVPCDADGFEVRSVTGKLGLRGQPTGALTYTDVRVPDAARIGEVDRGLKIALGALSRGRISVAGGAVGLGQAALDAAVTYSTQRLQFGRPIAGFQLVQDLLAESAVDVQTARMLTWHAARLVDDGLTPQEFSPAASMAKYHASEAAVRVANRCLQVFGGYGFIDEFPLQKLLRDARVLTLYEGTSQVQKLIIGRDLTGVDAMTS